MIVWRAHIHELVKYILFWMDRLSGSANDTACLSDRLCTAHSLHSCVVQIGPISCQLVAEHRVRPTTCSVAFSQATFDFLRQRTFLKFGLKEGREMQLLVNRDSLLLQIYPGSGKFFPHKAARGLCVCTHVCVCHGVNHWGSTIKAYQTPVELPSCARLSPLPTFSVSLSSCDRELLPSQAVLLTLAGSQKESLWQLDFRNL